MEDALQRLLHAGDRENRTRWAAEWKKQGKKVMGLCCSLVPEELLHAVGVLPWRIYATAQPDMVRSWPHRVHSTNAYYRYVLGSRLAGDLEFLDGFVATDWEMDTIRLFDAWHATVPTQFDYLLHVPHYDSETTRTQFGEDLSTLAKSLETFGRTRVTDDTVWRSIEVFDQTRNLMSQVYGLRKREHPPLSGAECLALAMATTVMPKEEFNVQLTALFPYLERRTAPLECRRPRVLLSTEWLDDVDYAMLIEKTGCLIAMDDTDIGGRRYTGEVPDTAGNFASLLAGRCMSRPQCPRMWQWNTQVAQIVAWCREYDIDAVIDLPLQHTYPRNMRVPVLSAALADAGIPYACVKRGYQMEAEGQVRTRVGALLEMLQ